MTATLTRLAFTIDAKPFASAVTWAAKRVAARPPVPTLGGILLEVAEGELTVSGTDQSASASATVDVDGSSDGRVLVSGRLLAALLGTFPDRPLQAVDDGRVLTLTCGRAQVALPLMPVEDYPALPPMPDPIGEVATSVLVEAVKLVGSACDFHKEKGVTAFTGINLAFGARTIGLDATNRQRAGWHDIEWTASDDAVIGRAALPLGTYLTEVVADLAGAGETVTISLDGNLLGLSTGNRSVVMPLLADGFKHFRKLLPPDSETPATVDTAELKRAVDRVRLLSAAEEVPFATLTFGDGELVIRGTSQDAATAEAIPCEYEGPATTITVSVRHMLASLGAAGGSILEMSFNGAMKPIVFTPKGADGYRHLVMPMDPAAVGKS